MKNMKAIVLQSMVEIINGVISDIIPSVLYMYRLNILFRLRINYITNMFIS